VSPAADKLKDAAAPVLGALGLGGAGAAAASADASAAKPDVSAAADKLKDAAAPVLGALGLGGEGAASASADASAATPDVSLAAEKVKDVAATALTSAGATVGKSEPVGVVAAAPVDAKVQWVLMHLIIRCWMMLSTTTFLAVCWFVGWQLLLLIRHTLVESTWSAWAAYDPCMSINTRRLPHDWLHVST
jgi:hypothetical protein